MGHVLDPLEAPRKFDTLFESRNRLRRALPVDPCGILRVDPESLGGDRVDLPAVARVLRPLAHTLHLRRWQKVDQGLAVFEHKSIEIYQGANTVPASIGRAADAPPAVRVSTQDHIRELFQIGR